MNHTDTQTNRKTDTHVCHVNNVRNFDNKFGRRQKEETHCLIKLTGKSANLICGKKWAFYSITFSTDFMENARIYLH